MRKFLLAAFAVVVAVSSCNLKPEPEQLPYSVYSTLNQLQDNSQFVMYLNFRSMKKTPFWQKHISDSLLNSERVFGSILNTFRESVGATVTDGLDELYYSNSWFGENAIILKGLFKRNLLDSLLNNDSVYSVAKVTGGVSIYLNGDNGLYFFFKDNFTVCASNYLRQIDQMVQVTDTSRTGLLANEKLMNAIQSITYKENLWLVTNERMFIRGIFANMLETTSGRRYETTDSVEADSTDAAADLNVVNLYKFINSLSFSAKLDNELKILVQGECVNDRSAKYLTEVISGLMTIAKLSNKSKDNRQGTEVINSLDLNRYGESVFLSAEIDDTNIESFRRTQLLSNPEDF